MPSCPCVNLKAGAAQLAVAAAMLAQSPVFFAGDVRLIIAAALHGAASFATVAVLIAWAMIAACGITQTVAGYRATLTHAEPVDAGALARSLGAGLVFLYAISQGWCLDPHAWGVFLAGCSRCALSAGLAYNTAGLWLQLRGPLGALLPAMDWRQPHRFRRDLPQWGRPGRDVSEYLGVIAELKQEVEANRLALAERDHRIADLTGDQLALAAWQQAVAERDRVIEKLADDLARATATRDRYQANGKRKAAQLREVDSFFAAPGVKPRLLMAVHSDRNREADAGQQRALDAAFVTLRAIYDRIEGKR